MARIRPTLLDLISSGTLPIGTKLFHPARIHPDRHVSAVVVKGGIRFGNQIYSTPTAAAVAVTGKPTDGWFFWKTSSNGRYLDAVRKR
ncbi:MAG TPA: hypothetical protein VGR71_11140 [Nitrospira sp.]|nr:hypothetical protein [Nitrospira sp.]